MEMKLLWTEQSIERLKDIFDYYSDKATISIAQKLIAGIIDHAEILRKTPNIGQREELLRKRKYKYHYLIYQNYKIIYWTSENIVYISTVFDTRQNPTKLKKTEQ